MTFLDAIFDPRLIVSFLIARIVLKRLFRFEAEVIIGTTLYFLYLVGARISTGVVRLGLKSWVAARKVNVQLPQKKTTVTSVLDYNSVYRLSGLEVIMGFDKTGRPLRVDLDRYHTLIAGTSGAGKTTLVQGIVAQLATRPGFSDLYDLYIIDLKHGRDYLEMWKPVVKGYYSLDDAGTSTEAVAALKELVETMHVQDNGRRKVVIIDEVANLTSQSTDPELKKHGFAVLMRIAAQLRDVGALVAATQRPHFQTIERGVTANLERKICMRIDDEKDAKLTLRFMPQVNCTDFKDGEFLLKEPGARNREQLGRSLMFHAPKEIDIAVSHLIDLTADNDDRMKVFKLAAATLAVGDNLPGVRQAMWKSAGFNIEFMRTCYKNFHHAGAVTADVDKRGQPNAYLLAADFPIAYRRVVEYIQAGKWESAPQTIGKTASGEE